MRILVTGGDGFVGRQLCLLMSLNHEVHILDNFSFGIEGHSYYQKKKIKVHDCDIREFDKVEGVISNIDPQIVYHLAAIHFIPQCEKTPDVAVETNVLGTINIFRALKEGTRVVFASSAAVYAPSANPHCEDTSEIGPSDIYGFTKLHAEHYINYFTQLKNLRTTIVRLFNVIGSGETNPHVLPVIILQLLRQNRIIRLGNIKPKRDYIYIADVAEGFAAIGLMDEETIDKSRILNLGTSQIYSVQELVNILSEIIGEEIVIDIDSKRVRETDRPVLCADIKKTSKLIGWEPKYKIKDALKATLENPKFRIPNLKEI